MHWTPSHEVIAFARLGHGVHEVPHDEVLVSGAQLLAPQRW
jgi:hypothetical protein